MGQMNEPCLTHGLPFTEGNGSTVEGWIQEVSDLIISFGYWDKSPLE